MEELSIGKITTKFTIKFILWTIVFFVVGAVILGICLSGKIMKVADSNLTGIDELEDMYDIIKGFIYGWVVVDIFTAILATKLSIRGVTKKLKITTENRPKIIKKITIVLIVIAILVIVLHTVAVKTIENLAMKEIDEADSFSELIEKTEEEEEELNEFANEFKLKDDDVEDAIDGLKKITTAIKIYYFSGIVFACMIPMANIFLKKKENSN